MAELEKRTYIKVKSGLINIDVYNEYRRYMGAIIRAKINSRERVALEKVVPLDIPFSVQIDVCSACNLKCNFCFHSDDIAVKKSGEKFGAMSFELFKKIIDDMKKDWKNGRVKKLRLFKIGEPLMNKDICTMVRYAKEAGVAECIEITTNGTLLNNEMSLSLVDAGLDILNISVNGINEIQYERACNYKINFEEYFEKIKFFYDHKGDCKVFIKYSDIGYKEEEKKAFYDMFRVACDEMFVETISATLWQDTDVKQKIKDLHKGTYGQKLEKKYVCPFLFTTMVINNRGIAHLCCVDWKSEYILGDLKTEKIGDIWNGERMKEYQRIHLSMQKDKIAICRKCESLSANTTDNIDEYADEILERLYHKK